MRFEIADELRGVEFEGIRRTVHRKSETPENPAAAKCVAAAEFRESFISKRKSGLTPSSGV